MTRDEVRELQRRLLFWFGLFGGREPADYSAHDVDGIAGPRTRTAIAAFAESANSLLHATLPIDGTAPDELRGILAQETERHGYIPTDTPSRIRAAAVALANVLPASAGPLIGARSTRHMVLGQVLRESLFGFVFATPDGSPSHNWGAIYAMGDLGRVSVRDTLDGRPVLAGAAWNSSAEVGARQLVELLSHAYAPSLERAAAGDAWGYARALWRDGPSSRRPSYFTGFPPGNASGAPEGTELHSAIDHWYRVRAYARMVFGGAQEVAHALGEDLAVSLAVPNAPADVK